MVAATHPPRNDRVEMTREGFRYKQTIVLRRDLKMSVGKLIAQACHASVESAEQARIHNRLTWDRWRREGAKKVILQVSSLEDVRALERKARRFEVPYRIIEDRGLTEVPPGTVTAIAIGPAANDLINKITGNLKLL
jgi:PTH2 family peptidyl-tRNA hydrolase